MCTVDFFWEPRNNLSNENHAKKFLQKYKIFVNRQRQCEEDRIFLSEKRPGAPPHLKNTLTPNR